MSQIKVAREIKSSGITIEKKREVLGRGQEDWVREHEELNWAQDDEEI